MLPIAHLDLRALVSAGRDAVRVSEGHGSPQTVAAVTEALCELPLTVMDAPAERLLRDALRALAGCEDAREWTLLADAEDGVAALLKERDGVTVRHPAVLAVAMLATRAAHVHGEMIEGSVERAAWERAYLLGLEALRATIGTVYGEPSGRNLGKKAGEFFTAVRRAVPYAALIVTRQALVEAARSYQLPVIGMRQPLPTTGRWQWARRVQDAVYLFEVMPPLVAGHPYGSLAVQRTVRARQAGPVRYFPLSPDEDRRRAVTEALYRI